MENQDSLKNELADYLSGRHAHASLEDATKGLPIKLINEKPEGAPYSCWELLEHIRIAQNDMLEFIENSNYKARNWPKDYWPKKSQKATKALWDKSLKSCKKDMSKLLKIVRNKDTDLLAPIRHGDGQTIVKEVLQIIDHTAYHTGEIIVVRRLLHAWK